MSSERVDEAVTTEPADVELEQVSLIIYEQKFICILIMQLIIRLILLMRLLYQSMVRIIHTGSKSWMAFDQGKSIMIFNIDFLVFHSEQKGSDCTEESMRISLPNYFVARHNERNAEGLRRFA